MSFSGHEKPFSSCGDGDIASGRRSSRGNRICSSGSGRAEVSRAGRTVAQETAAKLSKRRVSQSTFIQEPPASEQAQRRVLRRFRVQLATEQMSAELHLFGLIPCIAFPVIRSAMIRSLLGSVDVVTWCGRYWYRICPAIAATDMPPEACSPAGPRSTRSPGICR